MRLRSHLVLLTLVTILPMVFFAFGVGTLMVQRERAIFRRGASERVLALMTAVDAELQGHVKALEALAGSQHLIAQDLRAFHEEAQRALNAQPDWKDVVLALPSGQPVLEGATPLDAPLHSGRPGSAAQWESFRRALETGRPVIGSLAAGRDGHGFDVRVPIVRDGVPAYVLSASITPAAILELLLPQELPPDWVGVVVDAERQVVARTMNHQGTVGRPASASLRKALARNGAGWFRGTTLEGADVYSPYQRSARSGWTVATGIPSDVVDAGVYQTMALLAFGGVLAGALAISLATLLGRRIAAPINSLALLARSLGSGEVDEAPRETNRLQEARDVSTALIDSAHALREREEALRAADQAKDQFLAMLGHELRNPLSALTSAAGLLQMVDPGDPAARSAVEVIERQVQHMTRLIDDLLDVGRVTAGKITLSREPLDLTACACRALEVLRASGRLEQHDVQVDVKHVWVDADAARMEQIVANLVGNALKYTPAGGTVRLRIRRRGDEAVLEVSDTGCGIPSELLPHVFDLFVQDERSLDRSVGGLGIGLTLVQRLAELHGGRVFARSEGLGQGSRFTMVLPAIDAPAVEPVPVRAAAARGGGRHVLLVEDNEDARATLRAALERYGHRVCEASSGPQGIEVARLTRPEVAVVDIGLPDLDGYEVARRLRATPEGAAMLLIALTGYGQREVRSRAREAGFDDYLTKPVSPDELTRRIEAVVARRHSSRGVRAE